MKNLYKEYTKEYEFIYKANVEGKEVAGESEAAAFFDKVILKKHADLLKEFNEYTGDMIMSDREAVAFVFACEKLGLLD